MKYVIAACSYNKEDIIEQFIDEYTGILKKLCYENIIDEFEICILDDHSVDNTWGKIKYISNSNKHVKAYRLKKNIGQFFALFVIASKVNGDLITFVDSDLVFDPEEVRNILNIYNDEKANVIFSIGKTRSFTDKFFSNLFFDILEIVSKVKYPRNVNAVSLDIKVIGDIFRNPEPKFFPLYSILKSEKDFVVHTVERREKYSFTSYSFFGKLRIAMAVILKMFISSIFFSIDSSFEEEL